MNAGLQANAIFPKKLNNSLGQKKQESLTNLEKIYMSRIIVPRVPQMQPICQSYKPAEEPLLRKISSSKSEEFSNKKSSFVSKLKSKIRKSNTPNTVGNDEFNPSKSYKNVYNNKSTMKRSASSSNKSQKKVNNNVFGDGDYLIKRSNNFVLANQEGTSNSIELKNLQNFGIQINNNINVIINNNSNSNSNENTNLIKPLTNELINSSNLNGLINTKIVINGKKMKNSTGFMSKSKQKFNKINNVMAAMANERKGSNKDEKILIFPTDYLKKLSLKDRSQSKVDVQRGRENNFLTKEVFSKSLNNLDIK